MTAVATRSVWLIEDNVTLRQVLACVVDAIPGFRCTAQYQRCEDALIRLETRTPPGPDLVLLDVGLPGMSGLEGISRIRNLSPHTQVVILTVFDDDEKVYRAICAGACGYLLKGASVAGLTAALADISCGGSPISPRIARRVLEMFSKLAPRPDLTPGLTPRERQIIQGMADNLTNKEIAARLGLSVHTTASYVRGIYEKLHVNTRGGAVAKAMRDRLV